MVDTTNAAKKLDDLKLSDNFLFASVMQDVDNCKRLIELILGVKITKISKPETEKSLKFIYDGKGIRLDVYVENDDTGYDIEMQTTDGYLAKRARYYHSSMDLNMIQKGNTYKNLRNNIVIFICTFDAFGDGLPVYVAENRLSHDKCKALDDGILTIFLNTTGDRSLISDELNNLFDLINDNVAKDDFTKKLKDDINIYKSSEFWRARYMEWNLSLMDAKDEGVEIGKAEGMDIGEVKALIRVGYTPEKISETIEMPIEKVNSIIESLAVKG